MRGAAYYFADLARQSDLPQFDCVVASDFLNVAEWRALAPPQLASVPVVLYFHENQITYPLAHEAPQDFHYGWINLSSALAAEKVLFNSRYHRDEFLSAVCRVLGRMPDSVPVSLEQTLREKAGVFPLGIDFGPHRDFVRTQPPTRHGRAVPLILWNHRWEYDKAPERFVDALVELKKRDVSFQLILCGAVPAKFHPAFLRAADALGEEILHQGFFEQRQDYLAALASADVVVSTARHEFFGVAVAEAIFMGCLPLLPRALSYPELLPPALQGEFLYAPDAPFDRVLEDFLGAVPSYRRHQGELRKHIETFDWCDKAATFDGILEAVATAANPHR